jgi:hypothetical protein
MDEELANKGLNFLCFHPFFASTTNTYNLFNIGFVILAEGKEYGHRFLAVINDISNIDIK